MVDQRTLFVVYARQVGLKFIAIQEIEWRFLDGFCFYVLDYVGGCHGEELGRLESEYIVGHRDHLAAFFEVKERVVIVLFLQDSDVGRGFI